MMPGLMVAALKARPQKEWEEVFDALITAKQIQIEGTPDVELAKLKAQVNQIREVKNYFIEQRNRSAE